MAGLRALGEDGLLALGLSALEMTRVHVAFGRLHDKQAVGYLLARLEMAQHAPLFEKHDVDLDTFQLLTDDDLAVRMERQPVRPGMSEEEKVGCASCMHTDN